MLSDDPACAARSPRRLHAFPPESRLRTRRDFQAVFNDARRSADGLFTVLAHRNNLGHARLGLAISRKTSKKAVERNRIKRVARELFRERAADLPAFDLVAISRPKAAGAPAEHLRSSLSRHLGRLARAFDA